MTQKVQSPIQASSLKSRAAKGALWVTIEMLGVQAASFIVFVVMAHYVEPRDFGLISISYVAIQSLQMFLLYNATTVVARKQSGTDIEYTTTFWVTIALAIFCFLILWIFSLFAERTFDAPGLAPVLRAMSIVVLFMGLARTHETWLSRHFQFRSMALRGFIGAVAGGGVGIVMAINGFGVMALVGQQIVTSVVSLILLWVVCPWRPGFSFSLKVAREIMTFLRGITPNSFVYAVNQNCDTFLVASFFGPVNAGLYNVAKRIRLTLQLVTGDPIRGIALPTLAEMQNDRERLRDGVLRSFTLIAVVCAPVFFGASAVALELINVVFGQKWIAAAPVLEFLSFNGLAMIILVYNDNIFLLFKRNNYLFYVSAAYCVIAVTIFFICYSSGLRSMALPFVLPYLIVLPLSFALVSRCVAIKGGELIMAFLPGISSAIVMYIVVKLVSHYLLGLEDLSHLLILCIVGGITYAATIWFGFRKSALVIFDVLRHMLGRGKMA